MQKIAYTDNLRALRTNIERDFTRFVTRDDFTAKLRILALRWNTSARQGILQCLYKLMDASGIAYEKGRSLQYYENTIEAADIPDLGRIERRMANTLVEAYRQYPAPEDYLARTLSRIAPDEDPDDPLRLRILKRFVRHADAMRGAGYNGHLEIRRYVRAKTGLDLRGPALADHLDDGIFALLDDAGRAQKKPNGKFGVIKLADDLARSRFKGQGSTKRDLYLLALAYGMRFYPIPEGADPVYDIEKNLFRDYYTNNLIRFLSEEYVERPGDFEQDPSGRGINYKNFAEMVYLYYLARDGSPAEKLERATQMIERLRTQDPDEAPAQQHLHWNTGDFAQAGRDQHVYEMAEEDFEAYIRENYARSTFAESTAYTLPSGVIRTLTRNVSSMELRSEQVRAQEQFSALVEELENVLAVNGATLSDCEYGLWFAQPDSFDADLPSAELQDVENLRRILQRMNDTIVHGEQLKKRALSGEVTRAALLGAYFYLYTAQHEQDEEEERARRQSFADLYEDFKAGADSCLDAAGYAPLDSRSLFDLILTFSVYAQINF